MITVPQKRSLQDRLKEATKGSRASLFPDSKTKKVKEPEIIPDLRELIDSPTVRTKVNRLCQQIHEWSVAEREAKAAKKPLVAVLKELLEREGVDVGKFMVDELRVSTYDMSRSAISRDKLLAHNVSPKVIAECTETSTTKAVRISLQGEKESEE